MKAARWRTLKPHVHFTPAVFHETLDGGQAFRWTRHDGHWRGQWLRHVIDVRLDNDNGLEWRPVAGKVDAKAVAHYLAADTDFEALADSLPWRSDALIAAAMEPWRTLRLMRQPLPEVLLCFLCSSAKRIVQIRECVELMAQNFGEEFAPGYKALPTWARLAEIAEADLRKCKLGYRAKYIHGTAQAIAANPGWLERVPALPYEAAHAELCKLPGIGHKVADCVLLYSGASLQAFPTDTWIIQAMARLYGLDGWKPEHIAQFGRTHFGPCAGLAQQYLFSGERKG